MENNKVKIAYHSLVLNNNFQSENYYIKDEINYIANYKDFIGVLDAIFQDYIYYKRNDLKCSSFRIHIVFNKSFNSFQEFISYFNNPEITINDYFDYRHKISILKEFGPTRNFFVHDVELNNTAL